MREPDRRSLVKMTGAGALAYLAGARTAAAADQAESSVAGGTLNVEETQRVLDNAVPLSNYETLRSYKGRAVGTRITSAGVAGIFQQDPADIKSRDDGGTILVDAGGRRWKRVYTGPLNIKWFGAVGDGTSHPLSERFSSLAAAQAIYPSATSLRDELDWAATQAAIDQHKPVYVPAGTYLLNRTVFENTNGGAASVYGDAGYGKTVFKLTSAFSNGAGFHFGNNNGHSSYRLFWADITIDGSAAGSTTDTTGVIAHECGNSYIRNQRYVGLSRGLHLVSSTDVLVEGRNEYIKCETGIYGTAPRKRKSGEPATDTSVMTVFSPNNQVRLLNGWHNGGNQAIFIEGDAVEIAGTTCQSVGRDGTKHLIEVNNSSYMSASFKGPHIHDCWVEGGQYKYFVAVIKTRNASIHDLLVVGRSTPNSDSGAEGGVFIDAMNARVIGNSFTQFFTRPPQDGRAANAALYVTSASQGTFVGRDNVLLRRQAGNQYYFEGRPAPTLSNRIDPLAWGVITIANGVATVNNGANIAGAIRFAGIGTWQINFSANAESEALPVFITPISATPLLTSYQWNGVASVRIRFHDTKGAPADPAGLSIQVLGERVLNG